MSSNVRRTTLNSYVVPSSHQQPDLISSPYSSSQQSSIPFDTNDYCKTPSSTVSSSMHGSTTSYPIAEQISLVLLRLTDMEISLKKLNDVGNRLLMIENTQKLFQKEQKELKDKVRIIEANVAVVKHRSPCKFTMNDIKQHVYSMNNSASKFSFTTLLRKNAPLVEENCW